MMEYEAVPEDHEFDGFVVEEKPAATIKEEKKDKELNESQKEVVSQNVASIKSELSKMIVPEK